MRNKNGVTKNSLLCLSCLSVYTEPIAFLACFFSFLFNLIILLYIYIHIHIYVYVSNILLWNLVAFRTRIRNGCSWDWTPRPESPRAVEKLLCSLCLLYLSSHMISQNGEKRVILNFDSLSSFSTILKGGAVFLNSSQLSLPVHQSSCCIWFSSPGVWRWRGCAFLRRRDEACGPFWSGLGNGNRTKCYKGT